MQASRKTLRQVFPGLNKRLSPRNDLDLAKKREKNEEKERDRAKEEGKERDELGDLGNWSSNMLDKLTEARSA